MSDDLVPDNSLSTLEDPSIGEPVASAAEPLVPEPVAAKAEPVEDVEGLKAAIVAERRRRQEVEHENESLRQAHRPKPPAHPDVSDDDAEKYARRYELYTPNGLDLQRAKQIIADNRTEMAAVARQAAEDAVSPVRRDNATAQSRQNFVWAATQKDADGNPLVDPKVLADTWAGFPPELTAQPEVARIVLNAVVGETVRTKGPTQKAPTREPVYSEAPGGQRAGAYSISNLERKVAESRGISTSDWEKAAKTYQPGQPNRLD